MFLYKLFQHALSENLRQYVTTMVCVAVDGRATIGVIHKPFEDFTAWGWEGKGVAPKLQVSKTVVSMCEIIVVQLFLGF